MNKTQFTILFLAVISFLLLVIVYRWIDYLVENGYIVQEKSWNQEGYTSLGPFDDNGSPTTSHTVNLPLTTSYSCKNMCGPTARCYKTGQQCTSDIDCPGCQPYVPPLSKVKGSIPGENDAGKLTVGVTPTFSTLTTDIGTQSRLFTSSNQFKKAPQASWGVNTWTSLFDQGKGAFNERYQCTGAQFQPKYPPRYSATGQFVDEGPLASNAFLG